MSRFFKRQEELRRTAARGFEAVVPNPKLKLMDQVREVMRLRHYSIRTEGAAYLAEVAVSIRPYLVGAIKGVGRDRGGKTL